MTSRKLTWHRGLGWKVIRDYSFSSKYVSVTTRSCRRYGIMDLCNCDKCLKPETRSTPFPCTNCVLMVRPVPIEIEDSDDDENVTVVETEFQQAVPSVADASNVACPENNSGRHDQRVVLAVLSQPQVSKKQMISKPRKVQKPRAAKSFAKNFVSRYFSKN